MQRKKETLPFERKSHFNDSRDSYVDAHGNYVYTQWVQQPDGKWKREVVATIPFSEETRDIIILLDQDDHDYDLATRYDEENADYGIRNKQKKQKTQTDDDRDFDTDPIEAIPDPTSISNDDEPEIDPLVQEVAEFIRTELTEEQRDLLYAHLGEGRFLEDIRREEEARTGKKVSRQAVHNRWNRILTKACKHFGVDKPRQEHKKNTDQ